MTHDDGNPRKAVPGELCPCGRQARLVYRNPNGTEVGYCGLSDRGIDKSGRCPFCGDKWPEYGICPLYQIRPLVKGTYRQSTEPTEQTEHTEQPRNRDEGR